jgi:hypothetical protein
VQAFLTALPAGDMCALREGYRAFGPDNQTLLVTESLMDSHTLYFVANTETVYNMAWLDTKNGPLVIETPPNVLGFMSDFWSRHVTDVGRTGPDRGQGGKYLLLPPGYTDAVPDGYFVQHSRTYGNAIFFRAFMESGELRPAVDNTKQHYRVYPLDRAANPPAMEFVNISGRYMNTIPPSDASLFELVATVVQEEPLDAVDPETRGLLAAIGIRKDKPFAPDARMQAILAEAAAVGNATARAILFSTREPDLYYYPNSTWTMAYPGDDTEFSPGGVLDLDARTYYFSATTQISPAMWVKMVGAGSQYASAEHDAAEEVGVHGGLDSRALGGLAHLAPALGDSLDLVVGDGGLFEVGPHRPRDEARRTELCDEFRRPTGLLGQLPVIGRVQRRTPVVAVEKAADPLDAAVVEEVHEIAHRPEQPRDVVVRADCCVGDLDAVEAADRDDLERALHLVFADQVDF